MTAKTIPLLATIGLVSLMLLPAPGFWGLLIGVACTLAIVLSALLWLLDRIAARLARLWDQRIGRRTRRQMHAGSGMMRRSGTAQAVPQVASQAASQGVPRAASSEPSRPSPVQERARIASRRRAASALEPFRVR